MKGYVFYTNKFSCLLIFLFTGIYFSCTDKVDLDSRERVAVVHSILVDSAVQSVKLNYTSFVYDNYCPPVTEAEVYIEKMKGLSPLAKLNKGFSYILSTFLPIFLIYYIYYFLLFVYV